MSCILDKIERDYDKYVSFCELVNETPIRLGDKFYIHEEYLYKKYKDIYDDFKKSFLY